MLAGQLLVDAGVGAAGRAGRVEVGVVAEPGGDDGGGRDLRVVAAGQVVVAAGQRGAGGHGLAVGAGEGEPAGGGGDQVAEGVDDDVVGFAEQDQVAEPGLAALGPGGDVVDVGAAGVAAGVLGAALVALADGAAQRGGGLAVPAPGVEQGAVVVVQHPGHGGVAGQGPRGGRADGGGVVEVAACRAGGVAGGPGAGGGGRAAWRRA